jgi:hypothetical protein
MTDEEIGFLDLTTQKSDRIGLGVGLIYPAQSCMSLLIVTVARIHGNLPMISIK